MDWGSSIRLERRLVAEANLAAADLRKDVLKARSQGADKGEMCHLLAQKLGHLGETGLGTRKGVHA